MLSQLKITSIEQFDKAVNDAHSIVIYGTGYLGSVTADYFIETGKSDKIAAIVHTKSSKSYPQTYRQIPIREAFAFFSQPESKNALVIVSVLTRQSRNEIFDELEKYGVQACSYLDRSSLASILASDGARRFEPRSFIFTEGQLCDLAANAAKVVIYGSDELAGRVVKYLEQVGYGSKIQETGKHSIPSYPADPMEENTLVLAVPDSAVVSNVSNVFSAEIRNLDSKSCYFCTSELMEKLFVQLKNRSQGEAIRELQFVVAGFRKCGTTSLHYALREIEDVFLPDIKESLFMHRENVSKESWMRRCYSHVPKGSIAGCIEPSLSFFSREIREMFGPDLRICFLMRNPVGATFSLFKGNNRYGRVVKFLYDRYKKYCEEMFDDYITSIIALQEKKIWEFEYAKILEDFLRYYPMEQIKVVFFEELLREPGEKINEILRFIGSKEVYDPQLGLPSMNPGDFVWADQESLPLATRKEIIKREKFECLSRHILDNPETALVRANEMENEMFRLDQQLDSAGRIYNPKMTPEQRKRLEDFYRPGVRKLEKLLDKDLSKLWFDTNIQ